MLRKAALSIKYDFSFQCQMFVLMLREFAPHVLSRHSAPRHFCLCPRSWCYKGRECPPAILSNSLLLCSSFVVGIFLKKFRNHKLCKRLQNVIKLLTKQIIWCKKNNFSVGRMPLPRIDLHHHHHLPLLLFLLLGGQVAFSVVSGI